MIEVEKVLRNKGIKPSIHRMKILKYLMDNHNHPTIDIIYKDLVSSLPTLSKTTVYNTLNLFVEYKIANAILIEGNETRYDVQEYPHGHFKCLVCNNMIDFPIDYSNMNLEVLGAVNIKEILFYVKGTCEECKKIELQEGEKMEKDDALLKVKNLSTSFRIDGKYFNAVDGVSFELNKNEVLAIVGESGCGKSTLATSIMGLHNPIYTKVEGEILFEGKNLVNFSEKEFNTVRGKKIGMIFQDPLSALNPLMRIGEQIEEGLKYHTNLNLQEREKRVKELILKVGINNPDRVMRQFPHQLSGGMRQRIVIAIALSCRPDILIADEPTTALDVTIQAQILDLIRELQTEMNAGIILITHDLGVVAELADKVAVMYAGQIVEMASVYDLFKNPKHPYTRSLLSSIPQLDVVTEELNVIHGTVPSLKNLPRKGCRFSDRIPWISEKEHEENPTLHEVQEGHFVRCTCYKNFYYAKEGENNE